MDPLTRYSFFSLVFLVGLSSCQKDAEDPSDVASAGVPAEEIDTATGSAGSDGLEEEEPLSAVTDEREDGRLDVVAWVPSWRPSEWQEALAAEWATGEHSPRDTVTAIAAQFFVAQEDGAVVFDGTASTENLQWVKEYTATNQMDFLLCIHNNDGDTNANPQGWNWQLAKKAFADSQSAHIDALVALVDEWDADGIDIDYEGYENIDGEEARAKYGVSAQNNYYRAEFASFLEELGSRLHEKGKLLTVDILGHKWNQPNAEWMGDWVDSVDQINPMTYESGGDAQYDWDDYRFQQDRALTAGYKAHQYMFGMTSSKGEWGNDAGFGTSVLGHLEENLSGEFNQEPAPVAIWSGLFENDAWREPEVWDALHELSHSSKE
ncbi:MAG: glycosyl hydrolase family 18 protein [Polyangiaceae bacterium]|nr:glycosyl hydrolase family 18 protein [Polyangiaceae bacterium]